MFEIQQDDNTDSKIAVFVHQDVARFLGKGFLNDGGLRNQRTHEISMDDAGRMNIFESTLEREEILNEGGGSVTRVNAREFGIKNTE